MGAIRRKLRSERGASITFALLLFLVCAVVASVVLAAGTAAAGRLSQQAESDRRYYSVSSAVRLLQTEIEGATVTATRNDKDELPAYTVPPDQADSVNKGVPALLIEAAKSNLGDLNASVPGSIRVTAEGDDVPDVSVTVALDSSTGTLTLDVFNSDDARYTQRLTFTLDKREATDVNQYQDTKVTTATLKWILSDSRTVAAPAAAQGG